jgi:adenosylmethionine-8-amino-7-oxononanoate aminotransferase
LRDGLAPARALPGVTDVRVLGAIGVIEMDRHLDAARMRVATETALEHRVWLRPFRNLVYAMPPYICSDDEIGQLTSAMVGVARALT